MKRILLCALVVGIFGCPNKTKVPDKGVGTGSNEPMQMVMFNYQFHPKTLNVPLGKDVIFTNRDAERHCLSIESLSIAEEMEPNATYTHVFKDAGTFEVSSSCDPARMAGQIVVK